MLQNAGRLCFAVVRSASKLPKAVTWPVLWGLAGGVIGNLLRLVTIANTPREARPSHIFNDPMHYVQFVVLSLFGAFFALFYEKSGTHLTPVLAVNVGAAAPVIAWQFPSSVSPVDPAKLTKMTSATGATHGSVTPGSIRLLLSSK